MKVYKREQTDREKEKSKRGKRSKAKGKRGEKATADAVRPYTPEGYEVVQRNQGKWSGKHRPEVGICTEGNYHDQHVHFECKWRKRIEWKESLLQAERDAAPCAIPVVVGKYDSDLIRDERGIFREDPQNAPMVCMRLHDWLAMLEAWLAKQRESVIQENK